MKRTVIKTALITCVSVLVAIIITVLALFIIQPKILGDIGEVFGNHGVMVYFYKRQCASTDNKNDLYNLVYKLDPVVDATLCKDSTVVVINDFNGYYDNRGKNDFKSKEEAAEYIYGKYAVSSIKSGKYDLGIVLNTINPFYVEYNYTTKNPIRLLLKENASNFTKEEYLMLKKYLDGIESEIGIKQEFATEFSADYNMITNKIGE